MSKSRRAKTVGDASHLWSNLWSFACVGVAQVRLRLKAKAIPEGLMVFKAWMLFVTTPPHCSSVGCAMRF